MSNNSDTISKLNDALSTLIKAYEELQIENELLQEQVNELENEKEDLALQLSEFEDNTEKQNNNISSMLGKIESLLSGSKTEQKSSKPVEKLKEEFASATPSNSEITSNSLINNIDEEEISEENNDNENKIDLDRMASLLNGLGNR